MGQFFILRSRKFVNWNSPVFLKRYFFICSTYTSNKCFILISNNFKQKIKPWSTSFYTPFYKTPLKWIPRSKSGASKSRPRWEAHTRIGNVWEYPPGYTLTPWIRTLREPQKVSLLKRVEFTENCEGFLSPGTRNALFITLFMFIFTVDGVA